MSKEGQTPEERLRINESLIEDLRSMLRDVPVEVLGYIESAASCCGNGTVAIVKIDKGEKPSLITAQDD